MAGRSLTFVPATSTSNQHQQPATSTSNQYQQPVPATSTSNQLPLPMYVDFYIYRPCLASPTPPRSCSSPSVADSATASRSWMPLDSPAAPCIPSFVGPRTRNCLPPNGNPPPTRATSSVLHAATTRSPAPAAKRFATPPLASPDSPARSRQAVFRRRHDRHARRNSARSDDHPHAVAHRAPFVARRLAR